MADKATKKTSAPRAGEAGEAQTSRPAGKGRAKARRPRPQLMDPRELPLTPDVLNSNRVYGGAVKPKK